MSFIPRCFFYIIFLILINFYNKKQSLVNLWIHIDFTGPFGHELLRRLVSDSSPLPSMYSLVSLLPLLAYLGRDPVVELGPRVVELGPPVVELGPVVAVEEAPKHGPPRHPAPQ
jgi:hypothetical protein